MESYIEVLSMFHAVFSPKTAPNAPFIFVVFVAVISDGIQNKGDRGSEEDQSGMYCVYYISL